MTVRQCQHAEPMDDCPGCEYRQSLGALTRSFERRYRQGVERSERNHREELRDDWDLVNDERTAAGLAPLPVPECLVEEHPQRPSQRDVRIVWALVGLVGVFLLMMMILNACNPVSDPGSKRADPAVPVGQFFGTGSA